MLESIIVGLLSLLGTCIGSLGGMRLMGYRIEQLEKKVDKHNHFAERMPVVEEQIKVINHRVEDLERSEGGGH
nr:MAG TPA: hemolysin [Caudoviricetes sp.]